MSVDVHELSYSITSSHRRKFNENQYNSGNMSVDADGRETLIANPEAEDEVRRTPISESRSGQRC